MKPIQQNSRFIFEELIIISYSATVREPVRRGSFGEGKLIANTQPLNCDIRYQNMRCICSSLHLKSRLRHNAGNCNPPTGIERAPPAFKTSVKATREHLKSKFR